MESQVVQTPATEQDLSRPALTRGSEPQRQSVSRHPLFPGSETDNLRARWQEIQGGFVDEPRQSVQRADELVATVVTRLTQTFGEERAKLEGQWSKGRDVSTEDLRQVLQRYRAFFDSLLSV